MGYQQCYRTQENNGADDKALFIGDRLGRIRVILIAACRSCLARTQLLVEYQVKIQYNYDQGNTCDQSGIGQEIREGISQGSTDDDVGGISTHGSGSAQVRAEYLCQDHRHRIKFQQL